MLTDDELALALDVIALRRGWYRSRAGLVRKEKREAMMASLDSLAAKLRAIAAPRVAPSPTPDICAAIERAATWIELGELGGTPDAATLREFVRTPRAATVGELLEPTHIVEFMFEGDWYQAKRVPRLRHWQVRDWIDSRAAWSRWDDGSRRVGEDGWYQRARLVPVDQADASPESRGPIGEG